MPRIDIIPEYLHYAIERDMERFRSVHQTGLNIQLEELGHIEVDVKPIKTQKLIAKFLEYYNAIYEKCERQIELQQDLRKNMLDGMFC